MNWTSDHSIQYLKSNPMNKKVKIAYCIPSLYYPSGMERVLTLKANYFAEHLGYDIHIILTDGKGKEPYYKLYPSITTHQLDINYDELYGLSLPKRIHRYWSKQKFPTRFSREQCSRKWRMAPRRFAPPGTLTFSSGGRMPIGSNSFCIRMVLCKGG